MSTRKYSTIPNRNCRFNITKLKADIKFSCQITPVFKPGVRCFRTTSPLYNKQFSSPQSNTKKSLNNIDETTSEKVLNFLVAVVHKFCILLSLDVTKLPPKIYGLVTIKSSDTTSTYNFFWLKVICTMLLSVFLVLYFLVAGWIFLMFYKDLLEVESRDSIFEFYVFISCIFALFFFYKTVNSWRNYSKFDKVITLFVWSLFLYYAYPLLFIPFEYFNAFHAFGSTYVDLFPIDMFNNNYLRLGLDSYDRYDLVINIWEKQLGGVETWSENLSLAFNDLADKNIELVSKYGRNVCEPWITKELLFLQEKFHLEYLQSLPQKVVALTWWDVLRILWLRMTKKKLKACFNKTL